MRAWDAHYKAVSALAFTDDDSHIISGGKDSIINVWPLADIVDPSLQANDGTSIPPLVSWSEHALPVTSIHCSMGGVSGRIFSTSLDQTCKFWEIGSSNCLYSIVVPSAATAVTSDPVDAKLFVGTDDGSICPIELNAAAAAASSAVLRTFGQDGDGLSLDAGTEQFVGHTSYITGLHTSSDAMLLVSSSHDGDVRVWDMTSGQCLRIIHVHKGGVSSLLLLPYPEEDTRLHAYTDKGKGLATSTPLAPFKKYSAQVGGDSSEGLSHPMLLPDSTTSTARFGVGDGVAPAELHTQGNAAHDRGSAACLSLRQHIGTKDKDSQRAEQGLHQLRASAKSGGGTNGQMASMQSQQVQELEQENHNLQEENARWKRVNNQLYQTLVHDVLEKPSGGAEGESQRGAKKRKSA